MHWSPEAKLATALTVVSCLTSGTAARSEPTPEQDFLYHTTTTTTSRGTFCDTLCQQVTDGNTVTQVGGSIVEAISGSGGRIDIIQGGHITTSTGGSCGYDTSAVWKLWAQAHEHAFPSKLTQLGAGGNAGSSRVCIDGLTFARLTAAATQCYNNLYGAGGGSSSSFGSGGSCHQWQTGTGPMFPGSQGGQTGTGGGSSTGSESGGWGGQLTSGSGQQGGGSTGEVTGGGFQTGGSGQQAGGSAGGVSGGGSSTGSSGQQGGGGIGGASGGGFQTGGSGQQVGGFQAGNSGQQVLGGGSGGSIVSGGSGGSSSGGGGNFVTGSGGSSGSTIVGGSTSSTSSGWGHGTVHSESICFKIKSKQTDRYLTTYGSEYAFARLEGYYSVFKAYPSKKVAGGFTLTEINRNGGAVDYPVKQMTGTGVFKPLYGDKDAVWTFSPAAFGDSCWGVAGKKMAERQDWGGWGKNYREASSGEECVDIELEEVSC